jgi:hypothetical protein
MTTEPTTNEVPAQPENITPISLPVESADATEPTQEQLDAARKALEDDMRDAVPFNRLAIHTGFQRAIQAQVASSKPEKVGMLCTAFRNFAEAESLLRG